MSHPNDESDRKHLCDNPSSPSQDKEQRQCQSVTGDDLQVGSALPKAGENCEVISIFQDLIKGVRFIDGVNEHSVDELEILNHQILYNSYRNRRLKNSF